jgi:hypothetical protein
MAILHPPFSILVVSWCLGDLVVDFVSELLAYVGANGDGRRFFSFD